MAKQDYSNHRRFYFLHHFIFYPATFALVIASIYFADKHPEQKTEWYFIAIAIAVAAWLSFMVRQHYALTLQNRIVRLEMRLRYYQLCGKRFDEIERKLTFEQIAALRFASDAELPALVERTLNENLQPDAIKKQVTNWQPDYMRV
ncbi:MAG: hypothetical protein JNK79_05305 [Chitinophagaceae bacterium]|nr:hypothetical protein [Chitinophagaceae bacterium]